VGKISQEVEKVPKLRSKSYYIINEDSVIQQGQIMYQRYI